jgi:hypothetical protein
MDFQINMPILVLSEIEGATGLFAVDQSSGKAYRISAVEGDPVESGRIMMAISGQMRDDMAEMPREQIAEVIRTERELSEEAAKKLAERKYDARG